MNIRINIKNKIYIYIIYIYIILYVYILYIYIYIYTHTYIFITRKTNFFPREREMPKMLQFNPTHKFYLINNNDVHAKRFFNKI